MQGRQLIFDAFHPGDFAHHFEQFLNEGLLIPGPVGFRVVIVLGNQLFEIDVLGIVIESEGVNGEQRKVRSLNTMFPVDEGKE